MEGKVFNDSANLYQDQAKILFSYYKNAAEKIVAQEKYIEQQLAENKSYLSNYQLELETKLKYKKICWYLCFLIVPIFLAIKYGSEAKALEENIKSTTDKIAELEENYKNIFRDYKINKLGVAYVPVAKRVAFNGKSFVIDHSGSMKNEKFTLQIIKQNNLINSSISDLQILTKQAPVIETTNEPEEIDTGDFSKSIQKVTFHDYFGKLDRTLRTIAFCLKDVDESMVELPTILPTSEFYSYLEDHATSNPNGKPIFNVFNTKAQDANIEQFNAINETRKAFSSKSEEIDKTLRKLIVDMANSVQATSQMKVFASNKLVEYSNRILFNTLKASYNFYSPTLEADEIERIKNETFNYTDNETDYHPFNLRESSRVRFDLTSMSWVAEDGSRTIVPFGINQIQEEIMAPIVTNLMRENRKDRLAIYNHIRDQKIDYLNQWHRDTEDFYGRNRAEASDLINIMRSNLADYTANFNTLSALKKTVETMNSEGSLEAANTKTIDNSDEVMLTYKMQSQEFINTQNEFAEYMERLHDDIDEKAKKFGHVEFYDASLRDRQAHDIAEAADNIAALEDRRKPLAEVNPLLAKNSELPPEPSVDRIAYTNLSIDLNSLAYNTLEHLNQNQYKASNVPDEEQEKEIIETNLEEIEETQITEERTTPPPYIPEEEQEEDYGSEEYDDDESAEWEIGDDATYEDEDGNIITYEDGEYDLGNGKIGVVENGKVTNIYDSEE